MKRVGLLGWGEVPLAGLDRQMPDQIAQSGDELLAFGQPDTNGITNTGA